MALFIALLVFVPTLASVGIGSSGDPATVEVGTQALVAVLLIAFLWLLGPASLDPVLHPPVRWLVLLPATGLILAPTASQPLSAALGSLGHLAVVMLCASAVSTLGWTRSMVVVASALGLLCVLSFPAQALAPPAVGEFFETDPGLFGGGRLRGVMGDPNAAGRLGASAVLAGLAIVRSANRRWATLAGIPGLAVLIASQSRTSWAAVLAAMCVFAVRSGWARRLWPAALVAAIVVTCGFVAWPTGSERGDIASILERRDNPGELRTLTGRTDIWQASVDAAVERPFTGWGFNSSPAPLAEAYGRGATVIPVGHAHNVLLQVALTQGALGLALLLCAAASYVRRAPRRPRIERGAVMVAVLVAALSESWFVGAPDPMAFLLALCFGDLARRWTVPGRLESAHTPASQGAAPLEIQTGQAAQGLSREPQ